MLLYLYERKARILSCPHKKIAAAMMQPPI
nr:MAG TPA: hypothetical protein [Caudoviricetes sp.]